MAKLAFCGLGQMGLPMALRLVDAGHDLWVWNRTPGKAGPVVERGARQARSPAEAGAGAEAAITMLASPEALEEVVLGADGLAHGLAPGSTLIEMSTVGPQAIRALADRLPGGIGVLDAPVLGTVPQATEGSLKIFVGGPAEVAYYAQIIGLHTMLDVPMPAVALRGHVLVGPRRVIRPRRCFSPLESSPGTRPR